MASSPNIKVFNPQGEYIASCKLYEDAACLAGMYGDGAQIRIGHAKSCTVWNEGSEDFSAAESYDGAAKIMADRWYQKQRKALVKSYGEDWVVRAEQKLASQEA